MEFANSTNLFKIIILIIVLLFIIYYNSNKQEKSQNNPEGFTQKPNSQLILYYVTWCGHCKHFMPEWEQIKDSLKNNAQIEVLQLDCDKNNCEGIPGFPTIILKVDDNKITLSDNYPRSKEGVLKFLADNGIQC